MSIKVLKAYRADGSVRAIWTDSVAPAFRQAGVVPQRASNVEVIEAGPHRGRFHVDFTKLYQITGRVEHLICLSQVFDSYVDAVAAEVKWLETHWLVGS